jgi:hypothetical protein
MISNNCVNLFLCLTLAGCAAVPGKLGQQVPPEQTTKPLSNTQKMCLAKDAEEISKASETFCNEPCTGHSTMQLAMDIYLEGTRAGRIQEFVLSGGVFFCEALQFFPSHVNESGERLKQIIESARSADEDGILSLMQSAARNPVLNSETLTYLFKMGEQCVHEQTNIDRELHEKLIQQYMEIAKSSPSFNYSDSLSSLNACMEKVLGSFWYEN